MLEQPEQSSGGAPDWIVTFADLMSLLLTFFVLLLSFSNMEVVKFQAALGLIQNALGLRSEFELSDLPAGSELLEQLSPEEGEGKMDEQIVKELEKILEDAGLRDKGTAKIDERGVVLQLKATCSLSRGRPRSAAAPCPCWTPSPGTPPSRCGYSMSSVTRMMFPSRRRSIPATGNSRPRALDRPCVISPKEESRQPP
jgi:hypothetical protein